MRSEFERNSSVEPVKFCPAEVVAINLPCKAYWTFLITLYQKDLVIQVIEPNIKPNRRSEVTEPIYKKGLVRFLQFDLPSPWPREEWSSIGFRLMVPISPKDSIKKLN